MGVASLQQRFRPCSPHNPPPPSTPSLHPTPLPTVLHSPSSSRSSAGDGAGVARRRDRYILFKEAGLDACPLAGVKIKAHRCIDENTRPSSARWRASLSAAPSACLLFLLQYNTGTSFLHQALPHHPHQTIAWRMTPKTHKKNPQTITLWWRTSEINRASNIIVPFDPFFLKSGALTCTITHNKHTVIGHPQVVPGSVL